MNEPVATSRPPAARRISNDRWRDITNDSPAKDVFIAIMEGMNDRYRGLGSPSPPALNPLDQWIYNHQLDTSPRGIHLCAWWPDEEQAAHSPAHLVLAVTFKKPANGRRALGRISIEMVGINRKIYPRPSVHKIEYFGSIFLNKCVDLSKKGLSGEAPYGATAEVTSFRPIPQKVSWKPTVRLHDCTFTNPGSELLESRERERQKDIYLRFKVTKRVL
jgi:hypothetical protein